MVSINPHTTQRSTGFVTFGTHTGESFPYRNRRDQTGSSLAIPAAEVERRAQQFSRGIRDAGLRLTHQRLEISRVVAGDKTHPNVETLNEAVRMRVPTISLETVCRTLAATAAG
jgi:hypothetical protein